MLEAGELADKFTRLTRAALGEDGAERAVRAAAAARGRSGFGLADRPPGSGSDPAWSNFRPGRTPLTQLRVSLAFRCRCHSIESCSDAVACVFGGACRRCAWGPFCRRQTAGRAMTENLPRDGLVGGRQARLPDLRVDRAGAGRAGAARRAHGLHPGRPELSRDRAGRIDDTALDMSHRLEIEIVPTLIRFEGGREAARTYRLGPRRMGAGRRASPGSARGLPPIAARLRRQEHRARASSSGSRSASTKPGSNRAASNSATTRTSRRRCSRAAGRTGCRWCRRPRSACCACSTAPRATRRRCSASCRPTSPRRRSRRSRSTR